MTFIGAYERDDKHSEYNRSFFCLDTKERTKEKIKATGKTAENFSASLKQIKHVLFPECRVKPYLFFTLRSEIFAAPSLKFMKMMRHPARRNLTPFCLNANTRTHSSLVSGVKMNHPHHVICPLSRTIILFWTAATLKGDAKWNL